MPLTSSTSPLVNESKYWIILADTQLGAIHWQNQKREDDYYEAFQVQCTKAAEDPLCLGILGLGDIRERASLQAKNLGGLNRGLHTLHKAKKVMLATMGNHDYTEPNWITEMHYPSLKSLTSKKAQLEHGFDPDTTLALNFTTRSKLEEELKKNNPKQIKLLFLHQSLKELTITLKHSHDITLEQLQNLGFGEQVEAEGGEKNSPCLVFLGDIHNYGDVKTPDGNLQAAYPGSLEMTDSNEGINGLKSEVIESHPHDYRKFVIHYYPENHSWKPVEIDPRPWFRGKAKNDKETEKLEESLITESKKWVNKKPACVYLSVPKNKTEYFRNLTKNLNILEGRIDEYDAQKDDEEGENSPIQERTLSWEENKRGIIELAEASEMDSEALDLLYKIIECDGSTHNPKNDVLNAWNIWEEGTNKSSAAQK